MLTEEEFKYILTELQCDDFGRRADMLDFISTKPHGDQRILPAIEALLEDRNTIITGASPLHFGEVRLLAAFALVAERAAAGITKSVKLLGTFYPLETGDIVQLAKNAHIDMSGYNNPVVKNLDTLRKLLEQGLVPLYDFERNPAESIFFKENPALSQEDLK
jgi:hypothetical protein